MANYYIDTANGPRGPYPEKQIVDGIKSGKIPTGATLRDANTNQTIKAVELTRDSQDSGQQTPVSPYRAQGPAPIPVGQRKNPPAYPQHPQQPQYSQPNYPQGPYPQQGHAQPGYQQQQNYPQQAGYQPYGNQHGGQQYYAVKPTSGLAIASLVLSLATLVVCVPVWIGGIICGVMALKETEPGGPKQGRGMALAGLWIGISLGVLSVLFVLLILAAGG